MAKSVNATAAVRNRLTDASKNTLAEKRWSGVGPYYAMMPTSFALQQIKKYTGCGDTVLDPFCGRGTVPYAAAILGREFFGRLG